MPYGPHGHSKELFIKEITNIKTNQTIVQRFCFDCGEKVSETMLKD